MDKLTTIVKEGQRVLTTQQLAEFYETDVNNIQANFSRNKERFIEKKHYYKLEGEELKEFKNLPTNSQLVDKRTSSLILWTEKGADRHCKILDTDKAWEQFDNLEETYFRVKELKNNNLQIANKEIERLEGVVNKFERLTEEAKQQYKPSHKRKLDYNKMIKSLTSSEEDAKMVKEWVFGSINVDKWEDTCIEDTKRIMDIITTVSTLLSIKKIEQLRMF